VPELLVAALCQGLSAPLAVMHVMCRCLFLGQGSFPGPPFIGFIHESLALSAFDGSFNLWRYLQPFVVLVAFGTAAFGGATAFGGTSSLVPWWGCS
jgi:hypothetical protein